VIQHWRAGVRHAALDRIDLAVSEHEVVALVGTSGCGKTTLFPIVSGLERAERYAFEVFTP
jgi:ABC-type nitrate/sulfonate/bicarbonate transport system ATPase subunit